MSFERANGGAVAAQPEPFRYLQTDSSEGAASNLQGEAAWNADARSSANTKTSELQEQKAHERGLREGQDQTRELYESQLAATRKMVAGAIEQFKSEREAYFSRTEPEIVQLALAIARKILHREAQMDPMLLMGVVHVALEKLDAGTHIRLRAHPDDVRHWVSTFAQWNTSAAPEIIGDAGLQPGECALETELGSTHLSLDTQLKEIEQGFMDLLEQRPRVR
jgi:flagellar assembly protein FliH